jgi:hypothetical protein
VQVSILAANMAHSNLTQQKYLISFLKDIQMLQILQNNSIGFDD